MKDLFPGMRVKCSSYRGTVVEVNGDFARRDLLSRRCGISESTQIAGVRRDEGSGVREGGYKLPDGKYIWCVCKTKENGFWTSNGSTGEEITEEYEATPITLLEK